MASIIDIANAVKERLSEYGAQLVFCPEFELGELDQMKVCVVPLSIECKTLTRAVREKVTKIQVGFLKRGSEDDLEELLQTVESIGSSFLGKRFIDVTCVGVSYNPIYSPEHLRENGQFTSVIELSFKTMN